MASHTKGALVDEFCTQRKATCSPCNNRYTVVLDEGWASEYKFPQLKNLKSGQKRTDMISHNAHHILCVAEVTKVVAKDASIRKVVKLSKWCVNAKKNMIALPLFNHFVHWYCTDDSTPGARENVGGNLIRKDPPPFEDFPAHTYDHLRYNEEVESELGEIKAEIQEKGHAYDAKDLGPALDDLADEMRRRLEDRGKRRNGTHKAWIAGMTDKDDRWFEPYSLASDAVVTANAFPARPFDAEFQKNLERLEAAIANT